MIIRENTLELAKQKGFNPKQVETYYNPMSGKTLYKDCDTRQDELQKWLREKHNVHIWCEKQHKDLGNVYGFRINGDVESSPFTYNNWTYEEALEKGLQEALKLI